MGRADFELANLELIQRNSTEETKIVWQTRAPQKVDPASIARFRSAVRGEYADTKLLIYGLFQKGRVLAQDAEPQCVEASLTASRNDNRRLCPSGATPSATSTGTLIKLGIITANWNPRSRGNRSILGASFNTEGGSAIWRRTMAKARVLTRLVISLNDESGP